jgi:hypothetical protein
MPMPYTLAKGTILAVLEGLANPTNPVELDRLRDALAILRDPTVPLTDIAVVHGLEPATSGLAPLAERLDRFWFGKHQDASGVWKPQLPFGPGNTRTGYFKRYYGDVEAILRETLVRAIEVSFGLDHDAALADATRQWPVELLWKCPNPWFEGWVTWRRHGTGPTEGQVTVILATPGEDANPVINVAALPPGVTAPLPEPTALSTDDQGMWVVTHHRHVKHNVDLVTPLPDGSALDSLIDAVAALFGRPEREWSIPVPSTTWEGVEGIDVVHVPESAGGAAPFGAAFPA